MARKDYNTMILKRIELSFDKLMPLCALIAWISAIAVYFSPIPIRFAYIDGAIGFLFAIISIFTKQLQIETKITLAIIVPGFIGVLSFLDGGFSSSGMTLLLIANVVAVLFLSKKKSVIIAICSLVIFVLLWITIELMDGPKDASMNTAKWVVQFSTATLYLIVLQTAVFSIRKYLLENIAELEDTIAITHQLAYYDQLTGLPNYITMKSLIKERIIKSSVSGHVVYFKMKNLNLINSIYNHTFGDRVLIKASEVFADIKRPVELLARAESSVFVFWIDEQENESIEERIHFLESEFHNQFKMLGMTKQIEFYISYVKLYRHVTTVDECFDKATIALTYAKTHKMSGIVAYDMAFEEIIRYDEHLKELIKDALEQDMFTISYQEKIDVPSGKVVGVEALARWSPKSLGVIGPSVFVPIIEKMHMSVVFGENIIKKVFQEYKGLQKKYHDDVKVSINISPSHLASKGFIAFMEKQLEISRMPPEKVVLEITEEVMIQGIDLIIGVVKSLKAMGLRISLDDFGSGYSSLNYLVQIDIDELKIDRTFIKQIDESDKINIVLKMLINLANEYELDLVAEGVESKKQADRLMELGCHVIQGFYFSKPEPL